MSEEFDRAKLIDLMERFIRGDDPADYSRDAAERIEGEHIRHLRADPRFEELGTALAMYSGADVPPEPYLYTYADIKPIIHDALTSLREDEQEPASGV